MIEHQNHELKKIALFTPLHFEVVCYAAAAAAAKLHQSCPTLCDPIDSSQPGSSVPWILQARRPFPSPMHACMLSHFSRVRLCATLWTAAYEVLLSMGFSRQEYWSGLPFPSPGDLPDPEIKPGSPALQADDCINYEHCCCCC